MSAPGGTPSKAGLATAVALIAQLALLRVALDADEERAYFLGHALGIGCAFRARTGLPCPMCGVTRGVALTLHGELARAAHLYPAAPAVCAGVVALSAALVAAFVFARRGASAPLPVNFERRVRQASVVYAALCAALWLTDYASRIGTLLWRG